MNADARPADRLRPKDSMLRELFGKHNDGWTELQLGVSDAAARLRQPKAFGRAERARVEIDRLVCSAYAQIGINFADRDRAFACVRHRFYLPVKA